MKGSIVAKEIKKIEIVGPPGRIVVKETDLQRYLSKGYKLLDKVKAKSKPIPVTDKKTNDTGIK